MEKINYISSEIGNIPLILSVPHGGQHKFDDTLPERKSGIKGTDKNTIGMALSLKEAIKPNPSIIFSNIHRSKIDFNRPPEDAYEPNSILPKEIYAHYHEYISQFINYNLENWNVSYLLDIHGFEKSERPSGFMDVEIVIGTKNLQTIFPKTPSQDEKLHNIRNLIVEEFHNNDILVAPVWPRQKEYVLTGGYIVQKYGAQIIKDSKSLQIEFSDEIRYKNKILREKVINILAKTLSNYFSTLI